MDPVRIKRANRCNTTGTRGAATWLQQARSCLLLPMIAAVCALPVPAAAQRNGAPLVKAQDPQTLVKALQANGYQAKLTKDAVGDPMIQSGADGRAFNVLFYGCTDHKACTTIQFFVTFSKRAARLTDVNDWNSRNRFGRAYLAEDIVKLEMDVDLDDGGMSEALFIDNVEFWSAVMTSLNKKIETASEGE